MVRSPDGPAAAQPVQHRGRREQPEDPADGHPGQEQPDRGRVDAEARLDRRQPWPPRRDGDPAQPSAWWFWGAADNIRLPAATAIKLAEKLVE